MKTVVLQVRVTEGERAAYDAAASAEGLALSAWVRGRLGAAPVAVRSGGGAAKVEALEADVARLKRELARARPAEVGAAGREKAAAVLAEPERVRAVVRDRGVCPHGSRFCQALSCRSGV